MFTLVFTFIFMFMLFFNTNALVIGWRARRKIDKIGWAVRHIKEGFLNVSHKGKTFSITVMDEKVSEGLTYRTIPVYTCKNIYIYEELVAKLHTLESLFLKYSVVEVSNKRHEYEVDELINKAYKVAKKLEKERINKLTAEEHSKSFYD